MVERAVKWWKGQDSNLRPMALGHLLYQLSYPTIGAVGWN